jgi:hypothetical protein
VSPNDLDIPGVVNGDALIYRVLYAGGQTTKTGVMLFTDNPYLMGLSLRERLTFREALEKFLPVVKNSQTLRSIFGFY